MPLSVGLLAAAQNARALPAHAPAHAHAHAHAPTDPAATDSWRARAHHRQQLDARLGPRTHFAIDPSVIAPAATSAPLAVSASASASASTSGCSSRAGSSSTAHCVRAPWALAESRSAASVSPPEAVHAHAQPVFSPALPPKHSAGKAAPKPTISVQTLVSPEAWEHDPSYASYTLSPPPAPADSWQYSSLRPAVHWPASRLRTQYLTSYPGRGRRPDPKPLPYLSVLTYTRQCPRRSDTSEASEATAYSATHTNSSAGISTSSASSMSDVGTPSSVPPTSEPQDEEARVKRRRMATAEAPRAPPASASASTRSPVPSSVPVWAREMYLTAS